MPRSQPPPVPTDQELMQWAAQSSQPQPAPSRHRPNALTDADLKAIFANDNPNMPTVEDWARSGVTGLQKGLTGIMAAPDSIDATLGHAADWLQGKLGMQPGPRPTSGIEHRLVQAAHGRFTPDALPQGQVQPTLDAAVQKFTGPYHTPQSMGGRIAETAGEMAPAALLPGSAAARLGRVVLPTAGASIGGEMTHGTPLEPWAKMAGGMLGGLAEGGIENTLNAPNAQFGEAARGLTEDQIQAATQLRNQAAAQGIDLTIPEAVQQVTNGGTGLGRVQRFVESARRTAPDMAQYFAKRPDQMRSAAMGLADAVSPESVGMAPGMIGLDAQRAAQGSQMAANSARSQFAGPAYAAAGPEAVDPQGLADILQNVDAQIAGDKTGLLGNRLAQFKANLTGQDGAAINDIDNLSRIRNYWRDQIDIPPVGADPLSKEQAGAIGGHLSDLETLLKTNPNYAKGSDLYAQASRGMVDPLNAGPVGRIADTADLGSQTGALFPRNPPLGQSSETPQALGALGQQNPVVPGALTRQHLGSQYEQSARDLSAGPSQFGGAKYIADIMGNKEQAATLRASLDQLDPSGKLTGRLNDLADALQATGRRERPGSMTAFNAEDQKALAMAPGPVRTLGALLDPLEWGPSMANAAGRLGYNRNLDLLSAMMRDPDTAAILAKAQKFNNPAASLGAALLPAAQQAQP